jgi:hypothetical protein
MRRFLPLIAFAAAAWAAELPTGFLASLTPEQRARLGLAGLTAGQAAELDAAVAAYARQGSLSPAREAAPSPVAPAREPVSVSAVAPNAPAAARPPRPVAAAPASKAPSIVRPAEDANERFTAVVVGPFRGWSGGTYFPLTNGQVWRQVGTESNELPVREGAQVELYQSRNGYWRLSFEGAWITVRRLQ